MFVKTFSNSSWSSGVSAGLVLALLRKYSLTSVLPLEYLLPNCATFHYILVRNKLKVQICRGGGGVVEGGDACVAQCALFTSLVYGDVRYLHEGDASVPSPCPLCPRPYRSEYRIWLSNFIRFLSPQTMYTSYIMSLYFSLLYCWCLLDYHFLKLRQPYRRW